MGGVTRWYGVEARAEFEAWYVAEYSLAVAAIRLATGEAELAEEAVAEAFARAWALWPRVRVMESRGGWLYRVALNQLRGTFRRRRLERRHAVLARAQVVAPPGDPDDALWRAVARLAPQMRRAVALRYVADLPEAEVAAAMGVARGTVAATLHRAREQLARELREQRLDPVEGQR